MRLRFRSRQTRPRHWHRRLLIQDMRIPYRLVLRAAAHRHRLSRSTSSLLHRDSHVRMCRLTLRVRVPVIHTLLSKAMPLRPSHMEAGASSRPLTIRQHGFTVDTQPITSSSSTYQPISSRSFTRTNGRSRCHRRRGRNPHMHMLPRRSMATTTPKTTNCSTLTRPLSSPLSTLNPYLHRRASLCRTYRPRDRQCPCWAAKAHPDMGGQVRGMTPPQLLCFHATSGMTRVRPSPVHPFTTAMPRRALWPNRIRRQRLTPQSSRAPCTHIATRALIGTASRRRARTQLRRTMLRVTVAQRQSARRRGHCLPSRPRGSFEMIPSSSNSSRNHNTHSPRPRRP